MGQRLGADGALVVARIFAVVKPHAAAQLGLLFFFDFHRRRPKRAAREPIDRGQQPRLVTREVLRRGGESAWRDHGGEVSRPQVLLDEAARERSHDRRPRRRHVQCIQHDHVNARLGGVLVRRHIVRHRERGRAARRRVVRNGERDPIEGRDRLDDVVFGDLKIVLGEIAHEASVTVTHHNGDFDQLDTSAERASSRLPAGRRGERGHGQADCERGAHDPPDHWMDAAIIRHPGECEEPYNDADARAERTLLCRPARWPAPRPRAPRQSRRLKRGRNAASGASFRSEISELFKEHAWKALWRSAMACCRLRLQLRSRPLNRDRDYCIDRRNLSRSRLLLLLTGVHRLTRGWTTRRRLLAPLLVTAGLLLSDAPLDAGILAWLASAGLFGLLLLTAYILVLRHDLSVANCQSCRKTTPERTRHSGGSAWPKSASRPSFSHGP